MNNKRQTIWLVSMLSLMVILSAYYLFTEDSGPSAPPIAESTQAKNQQTSEITIANNDELVVNEVTPEGIVGDSGASEETGIEAKDESAKDADKQNQATEDKATEDKATDKPADPKADDTKAGETKAEDAKSNESAKAKDSAKTEEDVLKEVAAQANSASGKLESYQLDRNNKNLKLYDELMAKLGNQSSTAEETAQVAEQLKQLEDKESILLSIEEELQQQYENAVVKEENDRYNVVVLSDQLDAKRAAGIVDMVMKELKVGQDRISVQYVTP